MASKRALKKEINFIAEELFTECLFRQSCHNKGSEEAVEKILTFVSDMQIEFISRINRYEGKENKARVRLYFKKLIADFDAAIDSALTQITGLNQ